MGAYFRMCEEILDCAAARELRAAAKGDSAAPARVLLFLQILTWALSPSKEFTDAQALATYSGASPKQAQKVWDVCIKYNVLRRASYGYTARAWLLENKFLGRYSRSDDADKAFREGVYGSETT